MVYCQVCRTEWEESLSQCPICGRELREGTDTDEEASWVLLGTIVDKVSADFAREVLKSYEIPAVVISKSGFFGDIGVPLHPFYSSKSALFEVSVPSVHVEEAAEVLDMTLGDSWRREEK
ncbi:MAG TPA: hypothetical protein VMY05_07790 [Acidobacteriota bacterium]|nr:hypothetical protein [Acidobacteriota bacterium]